MALFQGSRRGGRGSNEPCTISFLEGETAEGFGAIRSAVFPLIRGDFHLPEKIVPDGKLPCSRRYRSPRKKYACCRNRAFLADPRPDEPRLKGRVDDKADRYPRSHAD